MLIRLLIAPSIKVNYAESFPEKKEKSGTFEEVPPFRAYEVWWLSS
jgi:hypothetical protein